MKLLGLVLNGLVSLGAATCIAYYGLRHGTGLFTVVPDDVAAFFAHNDWLQWAALVLIVAALAAKLPIIAAERRRKRENAS
jgi:hypothetical protein